MSQQRKLYPRGGLDQAGTWVPYTKASGAQGALFTCPACARLSDLSCHTISEDGLVNPTVKCGYEDCSYSELITLEGWTPA